jgi:hypothetical protein
VRGNRSGAPVYQCPRGSDFSSVRVTFLTCGAPVSSVHQSVAQSVPPSKPVACYAVHQCTSISALRAHKNDFAAHKIVKLITIAANLFVEVLEHTGARVELVHLIANKRVSVIHTGARTGARERNTGARGGKTRSEGSYDDAKQGRQTGRT